MSLEDILCERSSASDAFAFSQAAIQKDLTSLQQFIDNQSLYITSL